MIKEISQLCTTTLTRCAQFQNLLGFDMCTSQKGVHERLGEMSDQMSSTFGEILKIDSTVKVVEKLQGKDAGIATFVTNVGNENSEIVQSVLTKDETREPLQPMADGLVPQISCIRRNPTGGAIHRPGMLRTRRVHVQPPLSCTER